MELLELFCGYKSWTNPFIDGKNVIHTLDIDNKFNPSINQDILKWDYKNSGLSPDVIFASPDCTYFSRARSRWGYPKDKLDLTVELWNKTFEIINYFNPEYYLIENPIGKARHYFPDNYHTIDYCMYDYRIGYVYIKKPTDLWTNINMEFKRCDKSHVHFENFSSIVRGKSKRAVIPGELVNEIKKILDGGRLDE